MGRLRTSFTYANVMSTAAVFIALGGGAYAAVGSIPGTGGVIQGCYKTKGGSLRLVPAGQKCAKGERPISFNQRGPQGSAGAPGTAGTPGPAGAGGTAGTPGPAGTRGEQGASGLGAMTVFLATSTSVRGEPSRIVKLADGIHLEAVCGNPTGSVELLLTPPEGDDVKASGTVTEEGKVLPKDTIGASDLSVSGPGEVDMDLIAGTNEVTGFERVDAHASWGSSLCQFWVMATPSTLAIVNEF
jgi:hypothetical protein